MTEKAEKKELSNYKYIKTIGEGTFGKVKLAVHTLTGEKVAIKILQKNLIKDKNEYNRIEKEIKYLKLFNHPNIIQIYEVIESSSSFYIIMEYAQGGELFNYIVEKEKLTEKETSFYFYQIIQGVKEIHNKKICHRDIKPENLLFTKSKILKIIDFGLSSEYDEFLTTPCGSPCYASPEMIKGKKYNGLSIDLWACGVILFAMLCGYLPFDDKNNKELFKKIVECRIDYPQEDEVILSENSLDLINKILNPNPQERIGVEDILEHPFMQYGKKVYNNAIKPDNFNQEELIIDYMVKELGFSNNNNIIEQYIHSNKHNNITTTFNLLKQKYYDGRFNYSYKEKLTKKISKTDFSKIILNNKNSNNNISNIRNINKSFNTKNSNNKLNDYQQRKINYIKKKIEYEDKFKKLNNITYTFSSSHKKRSRISSCSHSKKKIRSLKDVIKNKDLIDRNNIIIINNTNMIQQTEKLKPTYNNLFFKHDNNQKNKLFGKIETSVSLEKSINKNNISTNTNNTDISNLNKTYNNNKNNSKGHIRVCLKKDDKNHNPFVCVNECKVNELLNKKKYLYLLSQNFSNKKTNKSKNKSHNNKIIYKNDFLIYKKNTTGMGGFINHSNNIYSFDGNNSNNFNISLSNNFLNGINYDISNFNNNKNSEYSAAISSSRNKKKSLKNIIIADEISNKYQNRNKFLNKNNDQNLSSTLGIYKDNTEIINNNNIIHNNNNNNYKEKFGKICKRIFKQNNKRYINYIKNNKKVGYDKKSKEKKRIEENFKNKLIYANHQQINKNKIKNECLFPITYRMNKVNKSINNINQLSNKIIVKNLLSRNINSNIMEKKSNQEQLQTTIENNLNTLKKIIKKNPIFSNKFYNKNFIKSFQEKNNKLTKKKNTLKNMSNNEINNINLNTSSSVNKKNKINRNIKDILSLKVNIKKN